MKCVFTINRHIYRKCLPIASTGIDFQCNFDDKISTLKELEPQNPRFAKLMLEAVDEVLSSLGDSVKQVFYFHLERIFKINKSDIPNKIEEFANAIEEILGPGAKLLEMEIMKRFYGKVGPVFKYFPEKDELMFTEYMETAKSSIPSY